MRWTRLDATRTGAAPVRLEGSIGLQLEVEQQRTEKEEGAERRIQQVGVLAKPAEPRAPREIALEQRSGIDVRLARDLSADVGLDARMQLAQLRLHHVMVVLAARVPRDGATRLASPVVQRNDDRVRRAWQWTTRVSPFLRTALEVVHDARMSRVDPCVEGIRRVSGAKGGDASELEAERVRVRLRKARELGGGVSRDLGASSSVDQGSRTAQRA